MALPELLVELEKAKLGSVRCNRLEDLAQAMISFQETVNNFAEEVNLEVLNLKNNGGGGATMPAYVLRALVAQLGNVPADQTTFPFDGATVLFKPEGFTDPAASGTAINADLRPFQDNEVIKLISFNGTTWLTDKIADDDNLLKARVNKPGDVTTTDLTFPFDNAVAIDDGFAPAGGIGTAINITGNAFADNEQLVLREVKNPQVKIDAGLDPNTRAWFVMQDDDDLGGGGTGGGTNLIPDWGIDDDLFEEEDKIAIDRRSSSYELGKDLLFGNSRVNNQPRWFRIDRVIIDIEDG